MDDNIRAEIEAIAANNDGRVTAEQVLDAAKIPGTALFEYFEKRGAWDPETAQRQFGLMVARECIKSIRVKVESYPFPQVPKFVRDPELPAQVQGYVSISRLRKDEDLAREALVNEFSRAGALLKRAQTYAALFGLGDELEEVRTKLGLITTRVEAAAADDERVGPAS